MSGTLRNKVVSGVVWSLLERMSLQLTIFIVSILLARLLTPEDYGTVALLAIFISIAGALADSGLGLALIQKKDANDLDFNSVFYTSLILSSSLYGLLFFAAPYISGFYNEPVLIPILRVMAVTIICNAISSVQNAELVRKMLFNLSFRISLISSIGSAIVGISMAFMEYGPWALVGQSVSNGIIGVLSRWLIIAWRPKMVFSFASVRTLIKFGWKMAATGIIDMGYNNLYGLLIGRFYTKAELAFVNRGNHIPQLGMETINKTIGRVVFPAFVQLQDDNERTRNAMRKVLQSTSFLVFPIMTGIAICANPIVLILFGEQWKPAVPFVQLECFYCATWPISTVNLQLLSSRGYGGIFLCLEIIKKMVGVALLFIAMRYGVIWMMGAHAFLFGTFSMLVDSFKSYELVKYPLRTQLYDVAPIILLCLIMSVPVFILSLTAICSEWMLPLQVLVGGTVYVMGARLLKVSAMEEYMRVLNSVYSKSVPRITRFFKRTRM